MSSQALAVTSKPAIEGHFKIGQRTSTLNDPVLPGVEFPVRVNGLFRPHYVGWSEQVDLSSRIPWIPDSKTLSGRAEIPLTDLAAEAFRDQMELAGPSPWVFPSTGSESGHLVTVKTARRATRERAGVAYFRIYDLRSTYGTRLSAGGVADERVTQMLRQSDSKVFKKYSQMKLQMRREALAKLDRLANEKGADSVAEQARKPDSVTVGQNSRPSDDTEK